MRIALIMARATNGVIGTDGKLPWHISQDLEFFKRITWGKPVIMGRKTYDSIGKPLPGRTNIVVTRNKAWVGGGVVVCHSFSQALEKSINYAGLVGAREVMVAGGADIYRQALDKADRIYLTEVHDCFDGDVTMDLFDKSVWREISRQNNQKTSSHPAFSWVVMESIAA